MRIAAFSGRTALVARTTPDSRSRWSNAGAAGCTSRQRNTHSTEAREVRYPWHPWFERSVMVYEALTKGGYAVCRCGFDDERNDRSLEVPAWMFEPAACDHLRLAVTPMVDSHALAALKTLLRTAPRADVLQAQHPALSAAGGADATVPNSSATLTANALSSAAAPSGLSGLPPGDTGQDDPLTGPPTPPERRPAARRRRDAGGAS
jgi:hypothetical protein